MVIDTEYRQLLPTGEILFATVPLQQMSDYGSLLTVPVSDCTTGIAIAGTGAQVSLHAYDHSGILLGPPIWVTSTIPLTQLPKRNTG